MDYNKEPPSPLPAQIGQPSPILGEGDQSSSYLKELYILWVAFSQQIRQLLDKVGEKVGESYTHDWISFTLPFPTRLQIECTPAIAQLEDEFPWLRFVQPHQLGIKVARFVRVNPRQIAATQTVIEEELESLCDSPIVLERPQIYQDHPDLLTLDLEVTGSRRLVGVGKRAKRRLGAVVNRRSYAAGESRSLRCTLATVPRGAINPGEIEPLPKRVNEQLGSLPWSYTPDRLVFTSKAITDRVSISQEFWPDFRQVAA